MPEIDPALLTAEDMLATILEANFQLALDVFDAPQRVAEPPVRHIQNTLRRRTPVAMMSGARNPRAAR